MDIALQFVYFKSNIEDFQSRAFYLCLCVMTVSVTSTKKNFEYTLFNLTISASFHVLT